MLISLLALLPIIAAKGVCQWKPTLDTTFILDLDESPPAPVITTATGLKLNEEVYHVDMEGSSKGLIADYHKKGKKVVCYISAGTWEPYRGDKLSFKPECYCGPGVPVDDEGVCQGPNALQNRLGDWNEWYVDIHSKKCKKHIKKVMERRIKEAVKKGCDGVDPDNVDEYLNPQTYNITEQDQVDYLLWWSKTARKQHLVINLKNAGDLLVDPDTGNVTIYQHDLVKAFDYNVLEQCNLYEECGKYDSFLAVGKPQIQLEYLANITECPSLKRGQKLLSYSGTNINSTEIILSCNQG